MSDTQAFIKTFQEEVPAYYIPKTEVNRIGEIVSGAFTNDVLLEYLLGRVSKETHRQFCQATYQAMVGDALMYSTDESMNNLIILCPPGYTGVPTLRFLFSGGMSALMHTGLGALKRLIAYEENCTRVRERFSDDKTWYLMTFAVRDGKMHQGLGSAIMHPTLDWLSRNSYSVFLETQKPENVEMYKHFGFETVDTCLVPGSDIKQFGMLK